MYRRHYRAGGGRVPDAGQLTQENGSTLVLTRAATDVITADSVTLGGTLNANTGSVATDSLDA